MAAACSRQGCWQNLWAHAGHADIAVDLMYTSVTGYCFTRTAVSHACMLHLQRTELSCCLGNLGWQPWLICQPSSVRDVSGTLSLAQLHIMTAKSNPPSHVTHNCAMLKCGHARTAGNTQHFSLLDPPPLNNVAFAGITLVLSA